MWCEIYIVLAAALLPSGVPHLLQQLHDKHELITEGTAWQLLLALHLLAEVLDPGSIWKHYIHSLPGPVLHGSSMSASEALMSPWVFFFK